MDIIPRSLLSWLFATMRKYAMSVLTEKAYADASELIRRVVCLNQAEILQNIFVAGELHRKAKAAGVGNNLNELKVLHNYLNENLYRVIKSNIEIYHDLTKLYKVDHHRRPRICVKLQHKDHKGRQLVFPFVRDATVGYNSRCCVDDNSASLHVTTHGSYYLCPNIPIYAQRGLYKNRRLVMNAVRNYSPEPLSSLKKYSRSVTVRDPQWIECWRKIGSLTPPYSTCYKSTLVVPITLTNNTLGPDFLELFKEKMVALADVSNAPADGSNVSGYFHREMFGALCLDHVELDYFNDDYDVHVGYIFADVFAIYLFIRHIYTTFSVTAARSALRGLA